MDNGAFSAHQRSKRFFDQVFAALYQHGNGDVLRDLVLFDQPAHEVVIRLAGGGEAHHDFLNAHFNNLVPKALLLLNCHGLQ